MAERINRMAEFDDALWRSSDKGGATRAARVPYARRMEGKFPDVSCWPAPPPLFTFHSVRRCGSANGIDGLCIVPHVDASTSARTSCCGLASMYSMAVHPPFDCAASPIHRTSPTILWP